MTNNFIIKPTYFRDDDFVATHKGIRYNLDSNVIDIQDCMTFVCPSENAAKAMKTRYFKKNTLRYVLWEDSNPKRQRAVCDIRSMLNSLAMIKKQAQKRAEDLAKKLGKLTAIVPSAKEKMDYEYEVKQANAQEPICIDTDSIPRTSTECAITSVSKECSWTYSDAIESASVGYGIGSEETKTIAQDCYNIIRARAEDETIQRKLNKMMAQEDFYAAQRKKKRSDEVDEEEKKSKLEEIAAASRKRKREEEDDEEARVLDKLKSKYLLYKELDNKEGMRKILKKINKICHVC